MMKTKDWRSKVIDRLILGCYQKADISIKCKFCTPPPSSKLYPTLTPSTPATPSNMATPSKATPSSAFTRSMISTPKTPAPSAPRQGPTVISRSVSGETVLRVPTATLLLFNDAELKFTEKEPSVHVLINDTRDKDAFNYITSDVHTYIWFVLYTYIYGLFYIHTYTSSM